MTTIELAEHPAKFSDPIQQRAIQVLTPFVRAGRVRCALDPFAGTGRCHDVADFFAEHGRPYVTIGLELEPEWAHYDQRTLVADVLELGIVGLFDLVYTSPCYGNRMADSHNARDLCKACWGTGHDIRKLNLGVRTVKDLAATQAVIVQWAAATRPGKCRTCKGDKRSKRHTYKHYLGRDPHEHNAGTLQWGPAYRDFHKLAWRNVVRAMRPHGLFLLNVSNHFRTIDGEQVEQHVTGFHVRTLEQCGLDRVRWATVGTARQRHGANRQRSDVEHLILFEKRRSTT